jgi:hypothetical protein
VEKRYECVGVERRYDCVGMEQGHERLGRVKQSWEAAVGGAARRRSARVSDGAPAKVQI